MLGVAATAASVNSDIFFQCAGISFGATAFTGWSGL